MGRPALEFLHLLGVTQSSILSILFKVCIQSSVLYEPATGFGKSADQPELAGARKHRPVLVSVAATDEPLVLSGPQVTAKSLLLTPV